MRIRDILTANRVVVSENGQGITNKEQAIERVSGLIASALGVDNALVERMLLDRERLQSTGIGDGVAIPHTSIEGVPGRAAALLLCPKGVAFEAIDGRDVRIVFAVVGPKDATSEHLRVLARISRVLRDADVREALVASPSGEAAYALIEARDRQLG